MGRFGLVIGSFAELVSGCKLLAGPADAVSVVQEMTSFM